MRRHLFIFLLLCLIATVGAQSVNIQVEEIVLANGLKILLYVDRNAPTVACRLFYKIGSVDEYPGISGAAHMFEHMMFKGTRKIGVRTWEKDSVLMVEIDAARAAYDSARTASADSALIANRYAAYRQLAADEKKLMVDDELWNLYLQNGGTHLNAFTTDILTAYFVTLPKNKLELFFWLESDRMQNAVMRQFYSERDVVAEERRLRYENRPTGRYWETLTALFYEAHPYRNPTIGWMSDIQAYSKQVMQERFFTYYRPNNAVLVLSGDLEMRQVQSLAKEYFGPIPRSKQEPRRITVQEPAQIGEKRLTTRRVSTPRIDLFFHTPGLGHPDLYALDIAEGVFSGRNGRLYKRLVKDLKLCTDAGAGNGVQKYTSYFHAYAVLKEGSNHDSVEAILLQELEKLKEDSLSDYEIQRVKNNVIARTINDLRSVEEIANQLGFWEVMGSWEYIRIFPEKVQAQTAEAVRNAAGLYFTPENRTVGVLVSKKGKAK